MPIRWYGPADKNDPTYCHFERIVNFCLHAGIFSAFNSGAWFVQEMRHPFSEGTLPWVTGGWFALLMVQLISVIVQRPKAAEPAD